MCFIQSITNHNQTKLKEMKTMINTNTAKRMLTSIMAITLFTTVSLAQGILLEGLTHAFKSIVSEKSEEEIFTTASFSQTNAHEAETTSLFSRKAEANNGVDVIRSFNVANFDLTMEEQVQTESWMTEEMLPANEEYVEVENWMTSNLLSEDILETEEWMTSSLLEEDALETEEWMFAPIITEEPIETEDWMTKALR